MVNIYILVAAIAFAERALLSSVGHHFDLESWWIVSGIVQAGDSVYANTHRYNYGPCWGYMLAVLRWLSQQTGPDTIERFHLFVSSFLSLFDIGIAIILGRRFGLIAYVFFLLNPIGIMLTGYRSHMDNVAILFGLAAWEIFAYRALSIKTILLSGILLGLSLSTKHILIAFLVWLPFLRRPVLKNTLPAMAISCVAGGLFLLSFTPWLFDPASLQGIRKHVIEYSSTEGFSIIFALKTFTTDYLGLSSLSGVPLRTIFIVLLSAAGPLVAIFTKAWQRAFYIYLLAVFALSSGTADQYLAVPLATVAISLNTPWAWLFTAIGTIGILLGGDNILASFGALASQLPFFAAAQLCLLVLWYQMLRRPTTRIKA